MNAFRLSQFFSRYSLLLIFFLCNNAIAQVPPEICASITQLNIDKQVNARAAEILAACGLSPVATPTAGAIANAPSTTTIGGIDKNVIADGEGTGAQLTQSETQVWAEQNTIVVTYNDSRSAPNCYGGGSYSLDAGDTWNNLNQRPFCSGLGTNYGDPFIVYDRKSSRWLAGFLATGCGGQGIGVWKSSDGINWADADTACAHLGTADDRESAWVDNSLVSPFNGRVYVSWNDFSQSFYNISIVYSDNGGTNWSQAIRLYSGTTFLRNVQISTGADGTVFVAAMNEGGGGLSNRRNAVFVSHDGAVTWSGPIYMGGNFSAAGVGTCGYFAVMSPAWRHMGWGDIGAGPDGVIHYVYTQHGASPNDAGDIYYTRSTDNGITWNTAIRLDTDNGTSAQWQANIAVSPQGHVFASWYDSRNTTADAYERWGRLSTDNGQTWTADAAISDASSPLPQQVDPWVNSCYSGDYDRSFYNGSAFLGAWVDGRGPLYNGMAQQDVFFDQVADTVLPPPPPPPPPPPSNLVLSGVNYKVKGVQMVDLSWQPNNSGNTIDILRDASLLVSVADSGAYTDTTDIKGNRGSFDYQVCVQQTGECSNVLTIVFSNK